MQWELTESSLRVYRRNRKARWEHAGRSLEEDCKTHRKNVGDCRIGGRGTSRDWKSKGNHFSRNLAVVPSVSSGCTIASQEFGQQVAVVPPKPVVIPPVPCSQGAFGNGVVGTGSCNTRTLFFGVCLNFSSKS
ncbi:hypothetical protein GW17_00027135 [Ensete ventricosum]|nr:hypothetical protein GW17_00027135 [Ensete ventricosum]